jgi:sulfite reductase (NADPH) hemoprotein beta-component
LQSPIHTTIHAYAKKISEMLMPKTRAYYEIWLDQEKILDKKDEEDPLYQDRYLPRKFKIAIGIPPNNDIDVLGNDVGLIAIIEKNELVGFNIAIGGGLSTTHGNPSTYARLASVIAFAPAGEWTMKAIYAIATIQRDFGNRSDRKLARLKYTVDRHGLPWFKEEIERRIGFQLEKPRPYEFTERKDYYGWAKSSDGLWYYTPFIENGRIVDNEKIAIKSALLEVAKTGKANFRFTGNQNLILADIQDQDKTEIESILNEFGVIQYTNGISALRKNSIACVALNTCPLALAEAQRYLPSLIDKIEPLLDKHGLKEEEIIIRMTGCPNGCGRPYIAEIGFVGTAYGYYNLHLGGDRQGTRLNRIYKENLDEASILSELDQVFALYKEERMEGENFGDYSYKKFFASN